MYSLYGHQVEHLKKDSEYDLQRGIHFIPTRGGKTNVMSDLCLKSFNYDSQDIEICIIVSPRRALNEQLLKDIMDYNVNFLQKGNKIGWLIWHSDEKDNADHSIGNGKYLNYSVTLSKDRLQQKVNKNRKIIIVSTLDSIDKLLETLQSYKINYIMFDEAHNLVSNEWENLVSSNLLSNIKKVRFFTATGKTSNSNVSMDNPNIFGKIIHKTTPSYLLSRNIIVPIHLYGLQVDWTDKTKTLVSEVTDETWFKILEDSIEEHKKWNQSENPNLEYNSIVVACPNCEFINKYQNETIRGHKVFGMISDDRIGSKKSQNNLEEFTKYHGDKILLHYDMVGEGITVKELSCAIALRALNEIKIVQFCGRICGKSENKTKGQVIIPCIDSLESSCNTKNFINIIKDLKKEDYNPYVMHHLIDTDQSRDDKDKENPLDKKIDQEQNLTDELLNLMPEDQFLSTIEVDKLKFTNLSLLHKKYVNYARYGRGYSLIQDKDFIDTPEKLCEEMVSNLPLELFKDPTKTFLDPCCGDGTFLWILFTKLMNGLIESFPDEKERMEHILSKQLYGIDINNHAITEIDNFLKKMFGTNTTWNIFCDDSLTRKFNMKFDVVVGNPPYQNSSSKSDSKTTAVSNSNLWSRFVESTFRSWTNKDGYALLIVPTSWMSGGVNNAILPLITSNQTAHLNLDCKKYFATIGSDFVYFCTKLSKEPINTKITCDSSSFEINISNMPLLPRIFTKEAFSIFNKVCLNNLPKLGFSKKEGFGFKNKSEQIGHFFVYDTKCQLVSCPKEPKNKDIRKVVISRSGYMYPLVDTGNHGTSEACYWAPLEAQDVADNVIFYMNSKLISSLVLKIAKYNGFSSSQTVALIPRIDFSHKYSEEDLCDLFNLTIEEKEFLNSV